MLNDFDSGMLRESLRVNGDIVRDELTRPSVLFRPRVFRDGDKWCALLGDDLESGVAGFGETPEAATRAFDRMWSHGSTPECRKTGGPLAMDLAAARADQDGAIQRMRAPETHAFGPPLRQTHVGHAVFSGADGEDPQMLAIFGEETDARSWLATQDVSGLHVEPIHAVAVADNDYRADWHVADAAGRK